MSNNINGIIINYHEEIAKAYQRIDINNSKGNIIAVQHDKIVIHLMQAKVAVLEKLATMGTGGRQ